VVPVNLHGETISSAPLLGGSFTSRPGRARLRGYGAGAKFPRRPCPWCCQRRTLHKALRLPSESVGNAADRRDSEHPRPRVSARVSEPPPPQRRERRGRIFGAIPIAYFQLSHRQSRRPSRIATPTKPSAAKSAFRRNSSLLVATLASACGAPRFILRRLSQYDLANAALQRNNATN